MEDETVRCRPCDTAATRAGNRWLNRLRKSTPFIGSSIFASVLTTKISHSFYSVLACSFSTIYAGERKRKRKNTLLTLNIGHGRVVLRTSITESVKHWTHFAPNGSQFISVLSICRLLFSLYHSLFLKESIRVVILKCPNELSKLFMQLLDC